MLALGCDEEEPRPLSRLPLPVISVTWRLSGVEEEQEVADEEDEGRMKPSVPTASKERGENKRNQNDRVH